MTLRRSCLVLLFAALSLASAPSGARAQTPITEAEALQIGTEAYIYGYPLVTMEMTRRVMTNAAIPKDNHAPMGQFHHARSYPSAAFRDVTAPNADTLYSTAWLDLSREPYVLTIPDQGGRYFLMPMLSGWTDVFADPGKRTTGTRAQTYAITGPGWKGTLPEGVKELKSPTAMVWILGRTYCSGTADDYRLVHAIQDKYTLVPLSAHDKPYAPPVGKVDPAIDMKTPVRDQVNRMSAQAYFKLLATLMKDNPATEADAPIVAKMAQLGIAPGKDFDIAKLDPDTAKGLAHAPTAAIDQIMGHYADAGTVVNGWTFSTRAGVYGTDYLQRAFITAIGLGANRPEDAIYPTSHLDDQGKSFNGANSYVMHFDPAQTPPARAFWSLTMYDADYFFAANPLNRFTLSPRNALKFNRDGSLDLLIQHESPGKDLEANWLPAPAGEFVLMLRLYWPRESVLEGSWQPPAVTRAAPPAASAARPKNDAAARPDDAKAIAATTQEFVKAFNRGDAKAIAALFTEDAEISDEAGEKIVGREPIARHFAEAIGDAPKATIELTRDSLRFLGTDAARETGRSRIVPTEGGRAETARYTVIYVRVGGKWLHDSVEELPDPAPSAHDRLMELEWLVGDWVDEGDHGVVQTSCRWSADKNFLLREFTLKVAGQSVSSGSQRIGWDAGREQFKSWVFDSDGGHSEGLWTPSGEREWTILTSGTLADGRPVAATHVLSLINKDHARWSSTERTIDGEALPDAPEILLVRTPPKPAPPTGTPK